MAGMQLWVISNLGFWGHVHAPLPRVATEFRILPSPCPHSRDLLRGCFGAMDLRLNAYLLLSGTHIARKCNLAAISPVSDI